MMSEGNPREIRTEAGTFRLTEEGAKELGPTPEMQARAQALTAQGQREREEQEAAGKVNIEELQRRRGEQEIEEYRQEQRRLWLANGGAAAEFDLAWPEIRAEYIWEKNQAAYQNVSSPY